METRKLKMGFYKSGSGSINAKTTVPITWLRKLGITPEEREFTIKLDEENNKIIIQK